MKKKILSIIMSACVLLTMSFTMTGAPAKAGTEINVNGGTISALTATNLDAVFGTGNYTLDADNSTIELKDSTYNLTNGITVGVSCTIKFNDATLDRNLSASAETGSVLTIGEANKTPVDVTIPFNYKGMITGGYAENGGGVKIINGTLNTRGISIMGNKATGNGGGVYVSDGSTYNSGDVAIKSNAAKNGGGVYIAAGGTMTSSGATIGGSTTESNQCYSSGDGGGIYVGGTLTMIGSYNSTKVTYNMKGSTTPYNNIYLPSGKTVTLAADCTFNTSNPDKNLYVTTADIPTSAMPVNIVAANAKDYSGSFASDNGYNAYSEADGTNWKINLTTNTADYQFTMELVPTATNMLNNSNDAISAGEAITYDVILKQANKYAPSVTPQISYIYCDIVYDQNLVFGSYSNQFNNSTFTNDAAKHALQIGIYYDHGKIIKNTAYRCCSVTFDTPDNAVAVANGTDGVYRLSDISLVASTLKAYKGELGVVLAGYQNPVGIAPVQNMVDVYADWLASFDTNGGSTVASEYVARGGKITKPADPTKEGFIFDKWCHDAGLNNDYDFDAAVNADTTLYAKWKAAEYKVTLNVNGGTGGKALTEYTYGAGATLPTDWTKSGCTFAGWYSDAQYTGNPVTEIGKTETGDKTFYAKWTECKSNTPPVVKRKSVGKHSVKLTWKKVAGATSYKVYQSTKGNGKYKKIGTVKGVSKTVKNLKSGKNYYFIVKAVTKNGDLKSKVIKVKTKGKATVSAWFKLHNTVGPIVQVTWKSQKGAAGYQVADDHSKGKKMKTQWTGKNSNNTYWSLWKTPGKTYKYKMRYFKIKNGKRVYSNWTGVKSIKVR